MLHYTAPVISSDFIFNFIQFPKLHSGIQISFLFTFAFYRMCSFGLRQILSNDLKYRLAHANIYGEPTS